MESEYVQPFNPLAGPDPESQALKVYSSLEKTWGGDFGPLIARGLRTALLTAAHGELTLAEIPLLFAQKALRQQLFPRLGEQEQRYWQEYDSLTPAQARQFAGPVTNKFEGYLGFSAIRRMLSCPEPLAWRNIVQEVPGITVLINLGVNRYATAGLMVGGLLFDSLLNDLMHFSRVHQEDATRVLLVLDEYQGLLTDGSVPAITHALCQGRKYKVSLLLLTQLMALIPSTLRATIRGNAGTSQIFGLGPDAREVVDDIHFEDIPMGRDAARQLVAFQKVGQSILVRRGQPSLLVQNTPPNPAYEQASPKTIQALYQVGIASYGLPAAQVDQRTFERREHLLTKSSEEGQYRVRRRTKKEQEDGSS